MTAAATPHSPAPVGFGTMRLTGDGIWGPPPDRSAAIALLRLAFDLGVRLFDTAWYYGPGVTSPLLAESLGAHRREVVVVTKVGNSRTRDRGWAPAQSPNNLKEACERDLRELRLDALPLVLLRWHPAGAGEQAFERALETLLMLQSQGKIMDIGLSNVTTAELHLALSMTQIKAVSNGLSLNNRGDLPTVRECERRGILYLPYYPLLAGSLLRNSALRRMAAEVGITAAQFAIAWLRGQGQCVVPIPGTSNPDHLRLNVAAQRIRLPDDMVAAAERSVAGQSVS